MKKLICLFSFLVINYLTIAQENVEIKYFANKDVHLNGQKVNSSTSIEEIKNILGEPVVFKEYPTGKVNYHYPEIGIAVHTVNNRLLFLGANFNWDGDKNFPETSFPGTLFIEEEKITRDSDDQFMSKLKSTEMLCPIPGMCITKDRNTKTPILIGFQDNLVTQVGFEFH